MSEFGAALRSLIDGWLVLEDSQITVLEAHYELMVKWNRTLNLTRVTTLEEAVRKHYGESLFVASQLPAGALRIVDVGSGAGFPGIPVAVARPECNVTLVESHQRKAVFLREATRGVGNVSILSDRAETLPEGSFDWMVSRAVAWEELRMLRCARRFAVLGAGDVDRGVSKTVLVPWDNDRVLARST